MNIETQKQAFENLKKFSENLQNIDVETIKNEIKKIKNFPAMEISITSGLYVDRVRPNNNNDLFTSENYISYHKNPSIIKNYGRANKPQQAMFYGAIESKEIRQQRVTAIFETSYLLKDKTKNEELLTVGRWETMKELKLLGIMFSKEAIAKNLYAKSQFEEYYNFICENENREFLLQQLDFFSNEFAKIVNNDYDYKISVALTDFLVNDWKKFDGVIYPSVASEYKGNNIVLRPDVVDEKLKLTQIITQKLIRKIDGSYEVQNDKFVKNFGVDNSNFEWEDEENR